MASSVSESSIARITDQFIEALILKSTDLSLDRVLNNALLAEHELRVLFEAGSQLKDPFVGLIDIFDVHPAARRARARHTQQGARDFDARHVFPLDSRTRKLDLAPSTVYNIDEFRDIWGLFSQGVLSGMTKSDWNNVIAAGGSVLACLMAPPTRIRSHRGLNEYFQSGSYASSDIDLFLWGLSPEQAETKMQDIYKAVRRSAPWPVICVRKAKTVSIHTIFPFRPVQIILRLYQSPSEILTGFDVDGSCCAYDGNKVWVNPRAMAALVRQANTIDLSRRSSSYEFRLAKYAQRGLEIYIPSLEREKIKHSLYSQDRTTFPNGLARLLVLEAILTRRQLYLYLRYPEGATSIFSTNNYDEEQLTQAQIPYGPTWDPARINNRIMEMQEKLNSPSNLFNDGKSYHRHVFIAGTMQECLRPLCLECKAQDDERTFVPMSGSDAFIRGRIRFATEDQGERLMMDGFRSAEFVDWSKDAYMALEEVTKEKIRIIVADDSESQKDEEPDLSDEGSFRENSHALDVNLERDSDEESCYGDAVSELFEND